MRSGKRRGENKRAEQEGHPGFQFWSRRPYFGEGKFGKMLTHRAERRAARHVAKHDPHTCDECRWR